MMTCRDVVPDIPYFSRANPASLRAIVFRKKVVVTR